MPAFFCLLGLPGPSLFSDSRKQQSAPPDSGQSLRVTQPGTKTAREKASSTTRGPSIGAAGLSLIAARRPLVPHVVSCSHPVEASPFSAGGREGVTGRGSRAGPTPFSLFPWGAQAVVVHSRQPAMDQGVWSRARHTRRGPPKAWFVSSVYQVGPGRQLTMEAARMPRGSAGWFPSFAASIKTADLVACQRPTASMAGAKDLGGLPAQPHSGCRMVCST